ncbi:MAG: terminase large subunit [Gammaproteobacteria bacterium]|nr:terminase large subunit [Gammaproteobacteria bacterium]
MARNPRAERIIEYLEGLRIGQGRRAGERFSVLKWEARYCRGAFAPGVSTAGMSMARANGKSTFAAGLGCASIDGPERRQGSEVLLLAQNMDVGGVLFRHIKRFLGAEKLADKKRWAVTDSKMSQTIYNKDSDILLSVKGADPRSLHGAAPSLILADEPAQWLHTQAPRLFAALKTSLGKIPGSLMLALGTLPDGGLHPYVNYLRNADFSVIYQAQKDDPIRNRRTWKKANPSLDHLPDLEAEIRKEAKKAEADEYELASFLALRLNRGVPDQPVSFVIGPDVWERIEGDAPPEGKPIFGVDLGAEQAGSSIAAYWPEGGRLEAIGAFPRIPSLSKRGLRDGVGDFYLACNRAGELLILGEHIVKVPDLLDEALDRWGRPSAIVADYYRAGELKEALKAARFPLVALELRRQGFVDGAQDLRTFRRGCLEGSVVPVPSIYLTGCLSQARAVRGPEGQEKLARGIEGGKRLNARDDGAAAALLAVGRGQRQGQRSGRGAYLGAVG